MADPHIRKTELSNGLVILTETMPHVHSASVGVWVRHGSRREPAEVNGISHFIEHMVFKGAGSRTAEQIARDVDRIGGMLDAFTSKELVCFNTRVLAEHLPRAFEILADMALDPKFPADEIEREKSVVLEEIRMTQDNAEDLVHELFSQNFWTPHPIGRPILGTPETVSSFTREALLQWFEEWYAPNHLVITAAGHVEHEQMLELVSQRFARGARSSAAAGEPAPQPSPHVTLRNKSDLEQVHLCLGVPALPMTDDRRFVISVLNNVLGGGMSSRLFQNIRERQGLAYAIFSDVSSYRDSGVLTVYAGTSLENCTRLVRSVLDEFRSLRDDLLSDEELRRAKDHLKGATLLALEGTGQRMSSLARYHIYFGRHFTPEELIEMLERVTPESVRELARELFAPERLAASVVGSLNGFRLSRSDLTF